MCSPYPMAPSPPPEDITQRSDLPATVRANIYGVSVWRPKFCKNCGAPMTSHVCDYCKTNYTKD